MDAQADRRRPGTARTRTRIQEMVDEVFNFRGGRRASEDLEKDDGVFLTIAKDARLLAGFTEDEIQRLVESARKSAAY